jgi:solute carrier family 39 (zinc transporter), member 1/2/3
VVLPLLTGLVETFEGLGIGSRLALLEIDEKHNRIPIAAALLYGLTTPIGIAAGLGVRSTYNPGTATASIVSGTMDSISSGILIYASLVEVRIFHSKTILNQILTLSGSFPRLFSQLMAHDFLFNKEMLAASNMRLSFSLGSMMLGAALMALLGKWA